MGTLPSPGRPVLGGRRSTTVIRGPACIAADPLTAQGPPRYRERMRARKFSHVPTGRMTRLQYEALVDRGVLTTDDRIELLDGRLVFREPQGSRHAATCLRIRLALDHAFGDGYHVRPQFPIALDDASE